MQNDDFYGKLRKKKVIVVTHVYGTGASQDLTRFLCEHKAHKVMYIGHPLFYDPNLKGSGYEIYEDGKKVVEFTTRILRIPLFLGYAWHSIKSFVWVLRTGEKWDLYIGSNNVNAVVGILLRRLGRVKKVVYYVIDFNPKRFNQHLINSFYQRLDQYCVRHADETWNMSPRMQIGRRKYFGFTGGNQTVVPVGLWLSESVSLSINTIETHTLAFVGHVQEKQGIQHVLQAVPSIVKTIPLFRFLVIGGGDYLPQLKLLAEELHIRKYVTFTGYIRDHKEIDRLLAKSALAVALYDRYDGKKISFSYFGNPTKLKAYFASGLPVILSDVPYNAKEIERAGCGKIVTYDPHRISDAVVEILSDRTILENYRVRVKQYRKKFDWNKIFSLHLRGLI